MSFHLYVIKEIYSNADGSIQFIELVVGNSPGQNLLGGHTLEVANVDLTNTFVFPGNLPSSATNNTSVLIATQGFADLGLVTPDYIVPDDFLLTAGGTLNFADVDSVVYTALPFDGVTSVSDTGVTGVNSPKNFAGDTGTIPGNPILGDSGANNLNGTADIDYMLGKAGIDTLNGQAGDDILLAGGSADTVNGGADDDTLKGGGGDDMLNGGDGDDLLVGSKGSDTLDGGEDNDTYQIVTKDAGTVDAFTDSGSTGTDTIDATRVTVLQLADAFDASNDIEVILGDITLGTILFGGTGPVIWSFATLTLTDIALIQGTTGADQITGSEGADKVKGLGGDDTLFGVAGTDNLKGGGGADLLHGGDGDDVLKGGGGSDDLYGDMGSDILTGGTGIDSFMFYLIGDGNFDTITDFTTVDDKIGLDSSIFAALNGSVEAGEFVANASGTPVDEDDYLIYNTSTGALYFDADGSGVVRAPELIVTLTGAPTIESTDFFLLAFT